MDIMVLKCKKRKIILVRWKMNLRRKKDRIKKCRIDCVKIKIKLIFCKTNSRIYQANLMMSLVNFRSRKNK